ncbi:sphinganine kinase lcb4 [Actinomortierella ambigua]|uniref:Sphinganine kinase lcb4 n=1 Tax=Actinomortierella ambigua TaxID=1343610 RepID=A0A9P6UAR6_9FUNG|nr:sphinganine kinase lcb4 [Actinomortierella ambigua]
MASFPFVLPAHSGHNQVELVYDGQQLNLNGFAPGGESIKTHEILNITIEHINNIKIATCSPKAGPKSESILKFYHFEISDSHRAAEWAKSVLDHVYKGIKRFRHFKVIVNPFGGTGKAKRMWEHQAATIFTAAGCTYDLTFTSHQGHATEIARDLKTDIYDGIITVSGDGVVHEVINGLMQRPDAHRAHHIPLSPLPGGSGNAICYTINGQDYGGFIGNTALSAIKGRAMLADLCSVTQGSKRVFSFLSQTFGMIADSDLGTEHLRWMGTARFTYMAIQRMLQKSSYNYEVSYIPAEMDKAKIIQNYRDIVQRHPPQWADEAAKNGNGGGDEMDRRADHQIIDRYGSATSPLKPEDGWVTERGPLRTIACSKMPLLAHDSMTHPLAVANDGLLDVLVFNDTIGSMDGIAALLGVEKGSHVSRDDVRYFKVKAIRITPLDSHGFISIDGEHFDWAPVQSEVHHGLISILSTTGRWTETQFSK